MCTFMGLTDSWHGLLCSLPQAALALTLTLAEWPEGQALPGAKTGGVSWKRTALHSVFFPCSYLQLLLLRVHPVIVRLVFPALVFVTLWSMTKVSMSDKGEVCRQCIQSALPACWVSRFLVIEDAWFMRALSSLIGMQLCIHEWSFFPCQKSHACTAQCASTAHVHIHKQGVAGRKAVKISRCCFLFWCADVRIWWFRVVQYCTRGMLLVGNCLQWSSLYSD